MLEVENLQSLVDLSGPLGYMDVIKRVMHEMTGVPEQALGQMQPISNTSGVALAHPVPAPDAAATT